MLNKKVIVILGGAGLLGSEFAHAAAREGAVVVVADTDIKKGEQVVKKISTAGGHTVFMECDATNEASVKKFAIEVKKRFKKIDGVVNTIYPRTPAWGIPYEDISYKDFITHVGLQTGPQFLTAQVFGSIMKKQKSGSLVFMGSIYGIYPPRFEIYEGSAVMPPTVEYAVAKGGLWALTRYLAKFYGPHGVRVNMLSPGGVWDHQDKTFEKRFNKHAVLGNRMANPDDLSPALVFLMSDASKYMTGQNLTIDGGWTL